MKQNKPNLFDALKAYSTSGAYPFHMPGHKRNTALLGDDLPLAEDITEIDGFDNLHNPEGILKDLAERLAALYGSAFSLPLVNGSTGGILAGIATCCSYGDSILMARNCHKSVYNAVSLLGLKPYYVVPPTDEKTGIAGSIRPEDIKSALELHPEIRLVVLTSPTYDGVLSDIKTIVNLAHEREIPVLVDEAHGAHLRFTPLAEFSAVPCGADIVIQSLHKTLPAMTQCAVAHVNGKRISPTAFLKKCAVFETSSPSYILLSSIALCVKFLEEKGKEAFGNYQNLLSKFSAECEDLEHLFVLNKGKDSASQHPTFFAFDEGKLPIVTVNTDIDGNALLEKLREEFALESEMAALSYALLMTSPCDTKEGFLRLTAALHKIDASLNRTENPPTFAEMTLPERVLLPSEAEEKDGVFLPLENTAGKIALDALWCYPPGIPLLVPGEKINEGMLKRIDAMKKAGLSVQTGDKKLPDFRVLD